jgi:anaerobic selenocysteine-containing dehydrogenase
MLNPEKYGVDYTPEVLIVHMANPLVAFASQPDLIESYKKFKFVAVIDPWLSETADYFADVVLPAATIEKYEGPYGATDQYTDAVALRLPPMAPLFQSRGDIDIYLDLCEQAGILYGKGGYLDEVNKALKLKDPYKLDLNAKPAVREIFDRWARSEGIEEGVAYFEKHGVKVKGAVKATKYYGFAQDPPFNGLRHRLYGEALLRYRQEMQAKGVEEIYWRDYTPLPAWRTSTMDGSPPNYDLYLISYKLIEFKQSRSTFIPLLAEQPQDGAGEGDQGRRHGLGGVPQHHNRRDEARAGPGPTDRGDPAGHRGDAPPLRRLDAPLGQGTGPHGERPLFHRRGLCGQHRGPVLPGEGTGLQSLDPSNPSPSRGSQGGV